MGATPVLTLAMAPDWMTNAPQPNQTGEPFYNPFYPPTPAHYDDFAELARQIARRYPDVKYFQVWNEMKGFAYPYTEYTSFYNKVYDALKGVDPSIQVGGFYLTLTGNSGDAAAPLGQWELDLFDAWLRNAHGADFVCLDGALSHFVTPLRRPRPATGATPRHHLPLRGDDPSDSRAYHLAALVVRGLSRPERGA